MGSLMKAISQFSGRVVGWCIVIALPLAGILGVLTLLDLLIKLLRG